MDLTGYSDYCSNQNAWKSYFKSEGTKIATYEPMNCRKLLHEDMHSALLFLQREGYTFRPSNPELLVEDGGKMQEFREI